MSAQALSVAIVALVNADTTLRTLFGRTTNLIVPFETQAVNPPTPILAYAHVGSGPSELLNTDYYDFQFSAFATSMATANAAIDRLIALLTRPALVTQSVDGCPNPSRLPLRQWPGSQAEPGESAECRADVTLSFLI